MLTTVSFADAGQQCLTASRANSHKRKSWPHGALSGISTRSLTVSAFSDVVRVGTDYTLKNDEQTGDLVVVAGKATVEGESHDTVVVFGNAEIASTANIEGSLVLIDSDTNVAEGAHVRGDLVVIGGQLTAPADFAAGGSHVVIDNHTLGGRFEGVFAWITRGLFLGRPIVPQSQVGLGGRHRVLFRLSC